MPEEATDSPTRLVIERTESREKWCRVIGDCAFSTTQVATRDGLLAERFGVVELRFRLEVHGGDLVFVQAEAAMRIGGVTLRLPMFVVPRVSAREGLEPGGSRLRVSVSLDAPVLGRLVSYSGTVDVIRPPS